MEQQPNNKSEERGEDLAPMGAPDPENHERRVEKPPCIYVASLADYNAGRLHGTWLDATQDYDALMAGVTDMLEESPEPGAEEWAIHDHEGFFDVRLSEFEPLSLVSDIARGIVEHGPAYAAWVDLVDKDAERLSQFDEAYLGEWDSIEAYAEELVSDLGIEGQLDRAVDPGLRPYVRIDYEAFARDMVLSGDYYAKEADNGFVYVFQAL